MPGGFKKFGLLLWKNYILQKRHKIQTVAEILVPVIFTFVLVSIRGVVESEVIKERTTFPPFSVRDDTTYTYIRGSCQILYAPNNQLTNQLMSDIQIDLFENYTMIGYDSESALLDAYKEGTTACTGTPYQNENPVLGAIIFESLDSANWNDINYVMYNMRFPAIKHSDDGLGAFGLPPGWQSDLLYPVFQFLGPRQNPDEEDLADVCATSQCAVAQRQLRGGEPGYYAEGFLYLQQAIDAGLRRHLLNDPTIGNEEIYLNRMPYPSYIDDQFIVALQSQLPLILVFSFIYSTINITKSVAYEKEKRLKESMKMMGLPNWLHWCAWFLKSYLFILASLILIVVLLKIKFYQEGKIAVLTYADGTFLYFFLMCYAFSMVTFSFMISTFFSTANTAATASGVFFFLSYFPYTFLQPRYNIMSKASKLGISILSNTGLSFGCQLLGMWEGTGEGAKWSNFHTLASPDDDITMMDITIMLLFDGFLYWGIAIYVESVWPGEYGLPLPWYFPFTKWYWVGTSRSDAVIDVTSASSVQKNPTYFEKEPQGRAGIQIKGLTKAFGQKIAVNNLTLNMYDNQITALLGHNGAGKTTTMSMLTGLFPPTSGTAIVNDFDILTDIKDVRSNLGLCPQHDVLFDEMTVTEHLKFFALLKGCEGDTVDMEVSRMLTSINLEFKKNAQARSLSGGMKRRLSVGIAFIGGSRVVLLDEPSSGLDPGARRQIWDLIQNEKRNRTIILSTHFMDEADLLGDRIAIMAEGQVRCCGSSLFLKKRYGGGYHLIIVKEPTCDVNFITSFLQQRIPEVEVDQNIGSELTYSLPDEKSALFADIFEELEARKNELGIASYGASITTMEEVFMRVGRQVEEEALREEGHNGMVKVPLEGDNNNMNKLYRSITKNEGMTLLWQQLWAMIVKKYLYVIRNKSLLAVQTIIPVIFLIITLIMLETLPSIMEPPAMDISLMKYSDYENIVTTVSCPDQNTGFCKEYIDYASRDSEINLVPNVADAIVEQAERDLPSVNYGYIIALEANDTHLKGFFNNQPFHAPPLALNYISNALLRDVPSPKKVIQMKNHPLPFRQIDTIGTVGSAASEGFNVGFTISFGMSFLAASFVVFLIKEHETNAKHLQVVSGVRTSVFWAASFLFDMMNYIIPCLLLMIVLIAFQTEDFKGAQMQGFVFVNLFMYGWAVIPLMYLCSFMFSIPSSGFTRMVIFNIVTGIATLLAISILSIEALDLLNVAEVLEITLIIVAVRNYYEAVSAVVAHVEILTLDYHIIERFFWKSWLDKYGYLEWTPVGIGRNMFAQFLIGALCFLIIFIKENKYLQKIWYGMIKSNSSNNVQQVQPLGIEDSDVTAERRRICESNVEDLLQSDNLILMNLTKMYGKFKAVDNLCLGVKKGECFGLLGINGAGKSTTFKMLTGDIPVTSGDAFVYSKSVKAEIKKVQRNIGYCPQFDALIPELTGRETIRLFARLRGVPEDEIEGLADALASKLLFSQHIDKKCGKYSGGNKRKLSTALALVGNPPMVLLDEPTTGMDPVARRHLWDAIIDVREAGTSIVLTSHSMDECEALSTRLAIMVNGNFRCLGSTQHLKNKFGDGYTIVAQIQTARNDRKLTRSSIEGVRRRSSANKYIKNKGSIANDDVQPWEVELQPLRNYIETVFPGAELKDIHSGYVHYHIKDNRITWGYMFRKMEEAKSEYNIEAYSVGQTTLEQVFLNFTRAQVNEDED